jgi:hypothetical protein
MPELPGLYLRLSVAENLACFADLYEAADVGDRIEHALRAVLADRAHDACGSLSKGLRQRVALARRCCPTRSTLDLVAESPARRGLDPWAEWLIRGPGHRPGWQAGVPVKGGGRRKEEGVKNAAGDYRQRPRGTGSLGDWPLGRAHAPAGNCPHIRPAEGKSEVRTRGSLATALLAALTIIIPLAGAAATQADSVGTAGQFTVSGTVTGASGPVRVWLYEWPSAAVVRSLRPAQKVPLRVLGEETTSSGRYAFSVNPATLPSGIVNMEVAAFSRDGMTAANFTRQRVTVAGTMLLGTLSGPAQMAPEVASLHVTRAAPNPCPAAGELFFKRNVGAKNTVVGATYSKASNFNTGFAYESGQHSSLGVGLSATVDFGDFHEDGTYGISSSASESFPTYHGVTARARITQFRYGLFRWWCLGPRGGGFWANYQTQPYDFAGGASDPGTNPNIAPQHCQHFDPGSGITLSRFAAWTFSAGVSIRDYIGINLSAQTGYDQGAQVIYRVTAGPRRWICGMRNYPGGSNPPPGLIQGH